MTQNSTNHLKWLTPTLIALFLYGFAQGLVKQFISEVEPARYVLYFFFAKSMVNLGYFIFQYRKGQYIPYSKLNFRAIAWGIGAYFLEGIGWVCYYKSIALGPISIVGTLSAAYAAPTVIFAYIFLKEKLQPRQYAGVALVILGSAGVSYAPGSTAAGGGNEWVILAAVALIMWGLWQTIVKHCYNSLGACDANMALYNIAGASLTTGMYGFLFGGIGSIELSELAKSSLPMGMMAGGDLGVIIATALGPVSIVTSISGAYPIITFFYAAIVLKETLTAFQIASLIGVLIGMFLSSTSEESQGTAEKPLQ